jgi:serine/threonine-protein kinase
VPFGKYQLLQGLGKGGMAEVFLARASGPLGFERLLVIKCILPHLSEDDEFREMFVHEAKLSAALAHGNIVQIYEFGEVDDQLFLAMEYVPGTDLRALLKQHTLEQTRMPPEAVIRVVIEVLQGLGYAHARKDLAGNPLGIVHRDVSPSNILLSPHGEVKLCDFGISKMAAHHTSTGRLKGKFAYMSPEQAAGDPVDARSDLFALGIVLWESLTGKRLFKGDSDVNTLGLVRSAEIPEMPDVGVPRQEQLHRILRRALARRPGARFPSAESFASELRSYLTLARCRDPVAVLAELVRARARRLVLEGETSGVVDVGSTIVTPPPEPDRARSRPQPIRPAALPVAAPRPGVVGVPEAQPGVGPTKAPVPTAHDSGPLLPALGSLDGLVFAEGPTTPDRIPEPVVDVAERGGSARPAVEADEGPRRSSVILWIAAGTFLALVVIVLLATRSSPPPIVGLPARGTSIVLPPAPVPERTFAPTAPAQRAAETQVAPVPERRPTETVGVPPGPADPRASSPTPLAETRAAPSPAPLPAHDATGEPRTRPEQRRAIRPTGTSSEGPPGPSPSGSGPPDSTVDRTVDPFSNLEAGSDP